MRKLNKLLRRHAFWSKMTALYGHKEMQYDLISDKRQRYYKLFLYCVRRRTLAEMEIINLYTELKCKLP